MACFAYGILLYIMVSSIFKLWDLGMVVNILYTNYICDHFFVVSCPRKRNTQKAKVVQSGIGPAEMSFVNI